MGFEPGILLYFMNETFNKSSKVKQLTNMLLCREEEKALSLKIVKDPSIQYSTPLQ